MMGKQMKIREEIDWKIKEMFKTLHEIRSRIIDTAIVPDIKTIEDCKVMAFERSSDLKIVCFKLESLKYKEDHSLRRIIVKKWEEMLNCNGMDTIWLDEAESDIKEKTKYPYHNGNEIIHCLQDFIKEKLGIDT